MPLTWIAQVVALPLFVAAAVTAALVMVGRALRPETVAGGRWAGALGIAAGYLAGHAALRWPPSFPPLEVTDRVPWLALAAAAWVVGESPWRHRDKLRLVGVAVLGFLTLGLTLGPSLQGEEGIDWGLVAWRAGLAGVAIGTWMLVEMLSQRQEPYPGLIGAIFLAALGAGGVLLISGSVVLGQLGLALSMAWMGAYAGWRATSARSARSGMIPVGMTVLTALVIIGHVYASVPALSAGLLLAAPAGASVGQFGPARRLPSWQATFLSSAATLALVALALGWAWSASPALDRAGAVIHGIIVPSLTRTRRRSRVTGPSSSLSPDDRRQALRAVSSEGRLSENQNMSSGREAAGAPSAREIDFRRHNFLGGIPVRLADGQEWAFIGPRELAETDESCRGEVRALLLGIAQAEDEADCLRGELALAIRLLSINYDLSPADYARLLAPAPGAPMGDELRAAFRDLARRHAEAVRQRDDTLAVNPGCRFRFPTFLRSRRDPRNATRSKDAR